MKSTDPLTPENEKEVEVETVDLASSQTPSNHEKKSPKAFGNLNRLHEKVTKGRSVPVVAIKKQPLSHYGKGREPLIPFINKDASAETPGDYMSIENDASWMDELPSPSTFFGKPYEKFGSIPEHTSTDYGSSWPGVLPSSFALTYQNDVATGSCRDNNTPEGFDLSLSNHGELEIEAAMVGPSDSVTMQEDSQVPAATSQMSSQADAFQDWSPHPGVSTPKLCNHSGVMEKSSGTSRLFMWTDSPERAENLGGKRKASVSDEGDDVFQSAPMPKRRAVGNEGGEARGSKAERQSVARRTSVKSGQPRWVYDLDPGLIAEWQDIVEFV